MTTVTLQPEYLEKIYQSATCLFSLEEIEQALSRMAQNMVSALGDCQPIVLCVMTGGLIFSGHLLPKLNMPLELDYIHATRYRNELSGADLHWKVMPQCDLSGRAVLILDDILDGGVTLSEIVQYCKTQGASSVNTAVLVDKMRSKEEGGLARADFTAFEVPDSYIFGFGMDYRGFLRNVPGIFAVHPEHDVGHA